MSQPCVTRLPMPDYEAILLCRRETALSRRRLAAHPERRRALDEAAAQMAGWAPALTPLVMFQRAAYDDTWWDERWDLYRRRRP